MFFINKLTSSANWRLVLIQHFLNQHHDSSSYHLKNIMKRYKVSWCLLVTNRLFKIVSMVFTNFWELLLVISAKKIPKMSFNEKDIDI